jgi:hypothetical protein
MKDVCNYSLKFFGELSFNIKIKLSQCLIKHHAVKTVRRKNPRIQNKWHNHVLRIGSPRLIQYQPEARPEGLFHDQDDDGRTVWEGKKCKDIPVTGRGGPYGCERSRLPHYLDKRLTDGGKVVSPTCRPPFTPRFLFQDSWYSFLLEAESTPGP